MVLSTAAAVATRVRIVPGRSFMTLDPSPALAHEEG
jgi:hypothetical protein